LDPAQKAAIALLLNYVVAKNINKCKYSRLFPKKKKTEDT